MWKKTGICLLWAGTTLVLSGCAGSPPRAASRGPTTHPLTASNPAARAGPNGMIQGQATPTQPAFPTTPPPNSPSLVGRTNSPAIYNPDPHPITPSGASFGPGPSQPPPNLQQGGGVPMPSPSTPMSGLGSNVPMPSPPPAQIQ